MPSTLTTERLILRPLAVADADDLYDMYRRSDAMRFVDTPPHASAAETRERVDEMLSGPGTIWIIRTAADGPALGFVEYIGNAGVPGMGYMLHPDQWGNGYMSEAVRAALDYGFGEMGLDRVELWIIEENTASMRLAERVGFRRRGRLRQKYHKDAAAMIRSSTALRQSSGARASCQETPRLHTAWLPYWPCRTCRRRPSITVTSWASRSVFYTAIRLHTAEFTVGNGHQKARTFSSLIQTNLCRRSRRLAFMCSWARTLTASSSDTGRQAYISNGNRRTSRGE